MKFCCCFFVFCFFKWAKIKHEKHQWIGKLTFWRQKQPCGSGPVDPIWRVVSVNSALSIQIPPQTYFLCHVDLFAAGTRAPLGGTGGNHQTVAPPTHPCVAPHPTEAHSSTKFNNTLREAKKETRERSCLWLCPNFLPKIVTLVYSCNQRIKTLVKYLAYDSVLTVVVVVLLVCPGRMTLPPLLPDVPLF